MPSLIIPYEEYRRISTSLDGRFPNGAEIRAVEPLKTLAASVLGLFVFRDDEAVIGVLRQSQQSPNRHLAYIAERSLVQYSGTSL